MAESPLYDLLLLLSIDAPDEQKARVLSLVESTIGQAGGEIERNDNWGRRPMAYQIRHQPEAEYHLLQFRAPGSIIEDLEHTLRITDGVIRVRIIKVRRGTPDAKSTPPPVIAAVAASAPSSSGASDGGAPRDAGPSDAAEESYEQPAEELAAPSADENAEQPAAEQPPAEQPAAE
jgi:small subunit ribosomal protein S6